jgi:dihydrofolate reductase
MTPKLTLVAAIARNGVIGRDGGLPWRLSSDLQHFKRATMGKPVLMGRKTWDSFPRKPLPGRPNLVLSRDLAFRAEGGFTYTKLDALLAAGRAMAEASGADEICIIGGSLLYAETLPMADRLRLSQLKLDAEGDTQFPPLDNSWIEVSREEIPQGPNDDAAYAAVVLERRR